MNKCYGVEKLYPLDDYTIVGYQEFQTVRGERVKTDSILVVKIENGKLHFSDPDGVERDYWLNRIGVISDEDFVVSGNKIKAKEDKRKLLDLLKGEFKE